MYIISQQNLENRHVAKSEIIPQFYVMFDQTLEIIDISVFVISG